MMGEILNLEKIMITKHAIDRFVSRSPPKAGIPKNPKKTMYKLLMQATEDKTMNPVAKFHRLLNNHYIEAIYFINSGWRFVIIRKEDLFMVVTAERTSGDIDMPHKIRKR